MKTLSVISLTATCALLAAMPATHAVAQSFPQKGIRFVVPFPPGGATDGLARVIGERLSAQTGQPVVIDNRPGAGGNIAAELVAKAPADGYTIFISGLSHAANISLYRKIGYHPLRDFSPITQAVSIDTFLVAHPSVPVRSVQDVIALAKAKPGTLNYASGGNGSSPHMAMELFKYMTKADLVHVPYKGTQSVVGMLAGEAALLFENLISVGGHVKSGRLRALAVGGAKRSAALPDVPTVAESGLPGYEAVLWVALVAPAGTPAAITSRLNRELNGILKSADARDALVVQGVEPEPGSPEAVTQRIKTDIDKWRGVVAKSGIKR